MHFQQSVTLKVVDLLDVHYPSKQWRLEKWKVCCIAVTHIASLVHWWIFKVVNGVSIMWLASNQLKNIQCIPDMYLVDSIFVVGSSKGVNGGGFGNDNIIEHLREVTRLPFFGDGNRWACVWHACHMPHISPSVKVVQVLLHKCVCEPGSLSVESRIEVNTKAPLFP